MKVPKITPSKSKNVKKKFLSGYKEEIRSVERAIFYDVILRANPLW